MDFMKLETNLGADVPSQRRADNPGAEEIEPCLVIPQHDAEVFRHIVHEDLQRMLGSDVLFRSQDPVGTV